jgi:hypothetical protein
MLGAIVGKVTGLQSVIRSPGLTWSGCAFPTKGILTNGRISLCPYQ